MVGEYKLNDLLGTVQEPLHHSREHKPGLAEAAGILLRQEIDLASGNLKAPLESNMFTFSLDSDN